MAIDILLVEDCPAQARITHQAMRDAKVANRLHTVGDGCEAVAYLRREDPYGDAPRPDLVFIDISLPSKRGLDLLKEIKADPQLTRTPVVLLTDSSDGNPVIENFAHEADFCIAKPVDAEQLVEVVRSVRASSAVIVLA